MFKTAVINPLKFKHSESAKPKLQEVLVKQIRLSHDRPRRILDQDAIDGMMISLSTAGQLQAIGVRRHGNGWNLIFGYLRFHAAQQLGWKTIQAMEYPKTGNSELLDMALWASENLHRSAPALDEMAVTVSRLADAGISVSAIATALGKPVGWVSGMFDIARDPLARRMIEVGRLADVEAWSAFIQLAPQFRKALLDSTVAITSKSCEQVQTQLKQGKKQIQFLQKAQQEDF